MKILTFFRSIYSINKTKVKRFWLNIFLAFMICHFVQIIKDLNKTPRYWSYFNNLTIEIKVSFKKNLYKDVIFLIKT